MPPTPSRSYLIDENLPRSAAAALRADGYAAEHVFEVGLIGHPDTDVFAYAQAHGQTVITGGLGLANIKAYPPPPHFGIVVLRAASSAPAVERIRAFDRRCTISRGRM